MNEDAILDGVPDLTDQKSVGAFLGSLLTELKHMKAEGKKTDGAIEKMAADLRKAQQRAAEYKAAAELAEKSADGADSSMAFYKSANGAGLRLYGYTDEGEKEADAKFVPGLLDDPNPRTEWQRDFQRACEDHTIATIVLNKNRDMDHPRVRHCRPTLARIQRLIRSAPAPIQREFSNTAGSGAEFIPQPTLPQLVREVEVQAGPMLNLFNVVDVTSDSQLLPVMTNFARPYLQGGFSSDNPASFAKSSVGTAERTISPAALAVCILVDDQASEDAIFDMMAELRRVISEGMAYGIMDAIPNADNAATHQDAIASWNFRDLWGTADAGAIDHRKAWQGLRARAVDVSNTNDWSTFNDLAFKKGLAKIRTPRGLNGDLITLASPEAMLTAMTELTGVKTADAYGSNVVPLTGEVAQAYGSRIIQTDFVPADLNASGLYDGSTTTKTGLISLNRTRFNMYRRRAQRLEVQRDATIGGNYIVVSWRGIFRSVNGSSAKDVHYGYNISNGS